MKMQYCGIDHKFSWHNTVTPSTIPEKWQVKKYTKLPDISSTIIQCYRGVDVEADLMAKLKKGVFKMRKDRIVDASFDGIFGGGVITPGKHAQALNVDKLCGTYPQNILSLFERKHMLKLDCIGVNVNADMINIHVKLHINEDQPIEFLQGNPHYPTCFRLDLHLNKQKATSRRTKDTITTSTKLATYIEVELTRWYNDWYTYKTIFTRIFKNEFNMYDGKWSRRCDLRTCKSVDEDNVDFSLVEQQWESVLRTADGADKRLHLATIIRNCAAWSSVHCLLVIGSKLPHHRQLQPTTPKLCGCVQRFSSHVMRPYSPPPPTMT